MYSVMDRCRFRKYICLLVLLIMFFVSCQEFVTETRTEKDVTKLLITQSENTLSVHWEAPLDADITSYIVQVSKEGAITVQKEIKHGSNSIYSFQTSLRSGTYTVTVLVKKDGEEAVTFYEPQHLTVETSAMPPEAPQITDITPQADSITLTWTTPNKTGKTHDNEEAEITGYTVYWIKDSFFQASNAEMIQVSASTFQHRIVALRGMSTYALALVATNAAGLSSMYSIPSTAKTLSAESSPELPSNVQNNSNKDGISISWNAPADSGKTSSGEPAELSYAVYWKEGQHQELELDDSAQSGILSSSPYSISSCLIKPSTAYTFILVTKNSAGLSSQTPSTTITSSPATLCVINTAQELDDVRKNLGGNYQLATDINFQAGKLFTAIGTEALPFDGSFDGNNKKIINLHMKDDEQNYVGLFGKIRGQSNTSVVLKDLVLVNPQISGNAVVGALVGYIEKGIIQNIKIESGSLSADASIKTSFHTDGQGYAGGIAGIVGKDAQLLNSSSTLSVQGTTVTGGLAGYNKGTVSGYSNATVSGEYTIGGLVGTNDGEVWGYASGTVSGASAIGGLVGLNMASVRGYATATVSGTEQAIGGLVGSNRGITGESTTVSGYAAGSVSGKELVGGLVGENRGQVVGYASAAVSGTAQVGGLVGLNLYHTASVVGYALGYIRIVADEEPDASIGAAVGQNVQGKIYSYVGRTEDENDDDERTAGSGDHVANGTGNAVRAGVIVQGSDSKNRNSFEDFDFSSSTWEWNIRYSIENQWPVLNFPANFPGGVPAQNPKIPSRPTGFAE